MVFGIRDSEKYLAMNLVAMTTAVKLILFLIWQNFNEGFHLFH